MGKYGGSSASRTHESRALLNRSISERERITKMDYAGTPSTTVELSKGPNMFGAQFYSFGVDFTVIEFPEGAEEVIGEDTRSAAQVMNDLADVLEGGGWTTQANAIRTAAKERFAE